MVAEVIHICSSPRIFITLLSIFDRKTVINKSTGTCISFPPIYFFHSLEIERTHLRFTQMMNDKTFFCILSLILFCIGSFSG